MELRAGRTGQGGLEGNKGKHWYQSSVKLIAWVKERSAVLYKAAINKVREVYPGARLSVVNIERHIGDVQDFQPHHTNSGV